MLSDLAGSYFKECGGQFLFFSSTKGGKSEGVTADSFAEKSCSSWHACDKVCTCSDFGERKQIGMSGIFCRQYIGQL